ncbi:MULTISPECIES: hypothetical protein [Pontibacillus]|uniref:Uncharacterized protein n=1 Tax=Pontibacillus chungwhensis TaxID=265426 RepID=A0ABY8V6W0_9BACI|nr:MULTISPECIES: hypothetical protein [Pontibacillus]MCD5326127.1 hypothetical protein [Pontibacillus sp. HN14]WIG00315.1 hypothetical protein QNI29_20930 [Pontibacillus chungwhensis]
MVKYSLWAELYNRKCKDQLDKTLRYHDERERVIKEERRKEMDNQVDVRKLLSDRVVLKEGEDVEVVLNKKKDVYKDTFTLDVKLETESNIKSKIYLDVNGFEKLAKTLNDSVRRNMN